MAILGITIVKGDRRSGKTTVATALEKMFIEQGYTVKLFDEDSRPTDIERVRQSLRGYDGYLILAGGREEIRHLFPDVAVRTIDCQGM